MGLTRTSVSAALHRDWRDRQHAFEEIGLARHIANFNLTGAQEPERVLGARVSSNLFRVLGVQPLLGRTFRDGEDAIALDGPRGADLAIVILSHGLWQRRFGGDPGVLGKPLLLSDRPHTIVGIMGPEFQYPSREFGLWVPLTVDPEGLRLRADYSFSAVGRLKPGITLEQAQADMRTVAANLAREYPDSYRDLDILVEPLINSTVAAPIRTALYVLLGAVGCLLLIGCANLANLLFARALVRGRELTVRAALGAGRGRLLLQSLTELLPILIAGGTLGILTAIWMVNVLVPFLPAQMPRVEAIGVNGPVLAFSCGALLLTGLLAGLLPALHASRADLATSMKDDSRGASAGRDRARLRGLLVIAQVAAAILLLIGASLLVRSFVRLASVDPGFKPDHAISLLMAVSRTKYDSDQKIAAYTHRIVDRVKALPGVEAAGTVNRLPLGSGAVQTGPIRARRQRPARRAHLQHRLAQHDPRLLPGHRHPAHRRPLLHRQRHRHLSARRHDRRTPCPSRVSQPGSHRQALPHRLPQHCPGSPSSASSATSVTTDSTSTDARKSTGPKRSAPRIASRSSSARSRIPRR